MVYTLLIYTVYKLLSFRTLFFLCIYIVCCLYHVSHTLQEEIGNELTNPMIGHLIRFKLCPALVAIVNDGRKPYRYQGLIEVSLWEAVYQLNEGGQLSCVFN